MKRTIAKLIACCLFLPSSYAYSQHPRVSDMSPQCDAPPVPPVPACDTASCDTRPGYMPPAPPCHEPARQRCNCAECNRTDHRTHIYVTEEQLAALAKKEQPVATRAPAVEPQGAFVAPPPVGSTVVEGNSFGIRGPAISLPEIRLALPTLELPSLFRVRHSNRMRIEASSAPYVTSTQLTQQAALAHQATAGQMGYAAMPQMYAAVQPTQMQVMQQQMQQPMQQQIQQPVQQQMQQPMQQPQQRQYLEPRPQQQNCDQLPRPMADNPNQELDALRQQLLECQQLISTLGNKVTEQNAFIEKNMQAPKNSFRSP